MSALSQILTQSYSQRMMFQTLTELDSSQRQLVINQEHEVSCLVAKHLKNEEARIKPKPRKGKKRESMSDEEETKLSESVVR